MNVSDVPRSLQSWVSTIHTVVLTADVFQLLRTGTSWAGQEALSGTISQYHAQFLEFEPDILTRDLKQAQQHIESRMQKNKRQIVLLWPAQSFCWSLRWGKVHRFFLFFFASDLHCFFELDSNHVSKFQVQNPKTQRGTAKILISSLYFKFIWHI